MADASDSASCDGVALTLNVQNLAGAVHAVDTTADALVSELKFRLFALSADYVVSRQRLFIHADDVAAASSSDSSAHMSAPTILANDRTLASYGLTNETTVHLFVTDVEPGTLLRTIGRKGFGAGEFEHPTGICVSESAGEVFVSDYSSSRVQVFRLVDGAFVRTIDGSCNATGRHHDMTPFGVCLLLPADELFVADGDHCVAVFRASTGEFLRTIGTPGTGDGQFKFLRHIDVLATSDELIVCDAENERVQVMRASTGEHLRTLSNLTMLAEFALSRVPGEFVIISTIHDDQHDELQVRSTHDGSLLRSALTLRSSLGNPISMCVSASGEHAYVTNWQGHSCIKLDCSSGAFSKFAGGCGAGRQDTQLNYPRGIAATTNELFIVDGDNHRVQVFAL